MPALAPQKALVEHLRAGGVLTQPAIAQAFLDVPRHLFLPGLPLDEVYADEAIPTKFSGGRPISSSSQPSIMAIMLEQLQPAPGQRLLEIGAGTGYNAALLGRLVGPHGYVVTVDIDDDLVQAARAHLAAAQASNVEVVRADGGFGYPPATPYDGIILTASAWDIAPAWHAQLRPGGRLVLPLELGHGPQQSLALVKPVLEASSLWFESESVRDCGFMRLRGSFAGGEVALNLGPQPGLTLSLSAAAPAPAQDFYAWLTGNSTVTDPGLTLTGREAWGDLSLWLGLHAPDVCSLLAEPQALSSGRMPCLFAYPGSEGACLSLGLVGAGGLSLLDRVSSRGDHVDEDDESFMVLMRAYGPEGASLAEKLRGHLAAWQAAGRPGSAGLCVRVYPAAAEFDPRPGAVVVTRPHVRLLVSWNTS